MASRSSLISDAFTLARAGFLNQVIPLNLTQYLTNERGYVPWATAVDVTGFIGDMLSKTRAYGNFQVKSYSTDLQLIYRKPEKKCNSKMGFAGS